VSRRRLLFVQPSLNPPGGGNGVAAWMLEALRHSHETTLLTWAPADLSRVDRFYGTSLRGGGLRLEPVARALRLAADRVPLPMSLLKSAVLARVAQARAPSFDVVVTANNEADLGAPAIQYVHYPCYQRPRPHTDVRWYHGPKPVLDAYYALADRIANHSSERMRRNLTLANSDWTGQMFTARHGAPAHTLYPPVPALPEGEPWAQRIDGFLAVGRIAPEKELERSIDIVGRLRARFPSLGLCLVGTPGPRWYHRRVLQRGRATGGWASLRTDRPREELLRLMGRYRYGLHGMNAEHFGMAPAELVAAGCVVFVHRSGGQVEIVDRDPRLTWADADEAVERIGRVLGSEATQRELRAALAPARTRFSTERFMAEMRRLVDGFPGSG